MKKYLVLFTILFVLVLSACGKTDNNDEKPNEADKTEADSTNSSETDGSEQGLKLQVLKGDEEAGATIENHSLYQELDNIIKENPSIGEVDDFSVYVVNTIHDDQGNSKLVLLGVNRLPASIKNIEFNYTLGNKDNEFVWEKQQVKLNEKEAGILEVNSAVPIVLPITEAQEALLKTLDQENQVMLVEDFTFEEVK